MKKVLLLEDEATATGIIGIIEGKGHKVKLAKDLWEAHDFLTEDTYDALMLDISVPGAEIEMDDSSITTYNEKDMNGYLYWRDMRNTKLSIYKGRIAFYSAFNPAVSKRAEKDGVSLEGIICFDKVSRSLPDDVLNWLYVLPKRGLNL